MKLPNICRASQLFLATMALTAIRLAGCAESSQPLQNILTPPVAMVLTVCDTSNETCVGSINFSLGSVRDLSFSVAWQNVPAGTHTQQIAFVQPNGVVYQTISHSFAVADGTTGSATTSDVVPVAGTYITQRSLAGDWSVEVSLDGKLIRSEKVQLGL